VTAEQPAFDPVAFKKTTRQGWDAVAEAWDRWTPVLGAWFGPVTEAMLDMARLRAGHKIVDVAGWRRGAGADRRRAGGLIRRRLQLPHRHRISPAHSAWADRV
jgi:hypothetical protein